MAKKTTYLLDKEIRCPISLANNCYHGLKHFFRSQFLNLRTKLNLYKTILKTVLMVVSAGSSTEEMRNSKRYLREGFSGKYLALYVIMENGVFVIIVK